MTFGVDAVAQRPRPVSEWAQSEFPQGLKPDFSDGASGTAEEAAEKIWKGRVSRTKVRSAGRK